MDTTQHPPARGPQTVGKGTFKIPEVNPDSSFQYVNTTPASKNFPADKENGWVWTGPGAPPLPEDCGMLRKLGPDYYEFDTNLIYFSTNKPNIQKRKNGWTVQF